MPTLQEQRDFLYRSYFGRRGQPIDQFISRAYRDMNRRLPLGQRTEQEKKTIYRDATAIVNARLHVLMGREVPGTAMQLTNAFDDWHSQTCEQLIDYYKQANIHVLCTFGLAQKWINMTLKYCWFFSEQLSSEQPRLAPWFPVAHVPVDEYILKAVVNRGVVANRPCRIWSGWNHKNEYLLFQTAIRQYAGRMNTTPLALEMNWWADAE